VVRSTAQDAEDSRLSRSPSCPVVTQYR